MAGKSNPTTREQKAEALIAAGAVQLLPGRGIALVAGSKPDEVYTVGRVNGFVTCTCPDHQMRGATCKHIYSVKLLCEEYRRCQREIAETGHTRVSADLHRALGAFTVASSGEGETA